MHRPRRLPLGRRASLVVAAAATAAAVALAGGAVLASAATNDPVGKANTLPVDDNAASSPSPSASGRAVRAVHVDDHRAATPRASAVAHETSARVAPRRQASHEPVGREAGDDRGSTHDAGDDHGSGRHGADD